MFSRRLQTLVLGLLAFCWASESLGISRQWQLPTSTCEQSAAETASKMEADTSQIAFLSGGSPADCCGSPFSTSVLVTSSRLCEGILQAGWHLRGPPAS